MLHPFVSVPSTARRPSPVLALSAALHAGLLYAAVSTTSVIARPSLPKAVVELVRFAELPVRLLPSTARRARAAAGGSTRSRARADALPVLTLPTPPAPFDVAVPAPPPIPDIFPDYSAVVIGGSGIVAENVLHPGTAPGARPTAGPYDAYDEVLVEKPVRPAAENRRPRYPDRLVERGIETTFDVTFVVDTSGQVDRETVVLPPTMQREFLNAVSDVLFSWRFIPAELGGQRVRQRVLQPFHFRVETRYGSVGP